MTRLNIAINYNTRPRTWCKWRKSEIDVMMLNTDGAVGEYNGFGGVFKNWHGQVTIGFTGSSPNKFVIAQEMRAIKEGLHAVIAQGYMRISVSSDSLRVVDIFNETEKAPWYYEIVLASILLLSSKFEQLDIKHVFIEGNQVADYLSKLCKVQDDCSSFLMPPLDSVLESLVEMDRKGTLYSRK